MLIGVGGAACLAVAGCTSAPRSQQDDEGSAFSGADTATLSAASAALTRQPDPALFDITDLASVSTHGTTIAYGINRFDKIVGYSMNDLGTAQAFDTALNPIYLPGWPSSPITYARAINPSGLVAGDIDISAGGGCYAAMTFTTLAPTPIALSPTLPGYPCSAGMALNNRGEVAGSASDTKQWRAVLWSWHGLVDLGTLGGDSFALGVNDGINGGQTVVGYSVPSGVVVPPGEVWRVGHAYVWNPGSGMHDLNDKTFVPTADGVELIKATGINGIGQIVGYAVFPGGFLHAYRLEPASNGYSFVDLGLLAGHGISYALAVNSASVAVGGAAGGSGNTAVLFSGGKVIDLEGALGTFDRLHWTLAEATALNDRCTIVGWGTHDGDTRAFKLTPRSSFRCPGVR
jgi:hypothetical protein